MKLGISRLNLILIVVLLVQAVALVALSLSGSGPVEASRGPLLANFVVTDVNQITVRDGSTKDKTTLKLVMDKLGNWTLPDFGDYPADSTKMLSFLNSLKSLDTRRLVAQNASSFSRLKVADDTYDRQIELKQGDKTTVLYLGGSSEANAAYARIGGQNTVYLSSGTTASGVGTAPSAWVNTTYFSVTQTDVVSLKIENASGVFEFNKDAAGAWKLTGSAPIDVVNADTVNGLVTQLSSLSLTTPLGSKVDDKYGMAKPQAKITIHTRRELTPTPIPTAGPTAVGPLVRPTNAPAGTSAPKVEEADYTLDIGAKLESGDYAVKASNSNFYVQVAGATAAQFVTLNRDTILVKTPTPTPSLTPTITPTVPASATSTVTPTVPASPTLAATATQAATATLPATATTLPSSTPTVAATATASATS